MVVSALIAGGIGPFLIFAWTRVERVSIFAAPLNKPLPLVNAVIMKSSNESVIAIKNPLKTPGTISGSTALLKAWDGVQPNQVQLHIKKDQAVVILA